MKQFKARVEANRGIAKDYYQLRFTWPAEIEEPRPGQFISIKSFGTTDLILRRPFAVSDFAAGSGTAAIIYQKRGKATTMLVGKEPGDDIDVIGPLGNHFPESHGGRTVLVGGGVGLGPLLFFGNWLASRGSKPTVVLGFRDASFLPGLVQGARGLGFVPVICTDDGSVGFHGTTVDWLRSQAAGEADDFSGAVFYTCGPNAMMAGCSRFCQERNHVCWASMEQVMGCGVGACIGCAIPVHGGTGYARVCTEGPVFDSREIQWERMR